MSEAESIGADWPQYRSHKVVRAVEITSVATTKHEFSMRLGERQYHNVDIADPLIARYKPVAGDFLVRYEPDGYLSVSPRDKFLDGYAKLADPEDELEGVATPLVFDAAGRPLTGVVPAPIEKAMEARDNGLDIPPRPNADFWNLTESVDWPANQRDGIMAFCALTGSPVPGDIAADRYSDTMNEAERKVWRLRLRNALRNKEGQGFMDFGRALYFLKEGRKMRRTAWGEGGDDFVTLGRFGAAPKLIWRENAESAGSPTGMSTEDMLATDWTVVP